MKQGVCELLLINKRLFINLSNIKVYFINLSPYIECLIEVIGFLAKVSVVAKVPS